MNDVDRFIHFSQFRDQIRGSQTHLIVGIDIAKDKHHAFFGTANGKTLWPQKLLTFNSTQRFIPCRSIF